MNYSIDITVATKRDLADAFDYIDGMLMNPSAADRLIDNAWKQFRSLDIFPQRFPIVTDPMLAGWKIRFFPVFFFRFFSFKKGFSGEFYASHKSGYLAKVCFKT